MELSLVELGKLCVSSISVGFLLSCIPMLIGSVVHGMLRIFKQA